MENEWWNEIITITIQYHVKIKFEQYFSLMANFWNFESITVDTQKIATVIVRNRVNIAYNHEQRSFLKFEKIKNIKSPYF